jgi:hypothetical protein
MLVPHGGTHIRVAHDIHHHRQISGCSIRRRTKGMTCAIEHQGPGQSSFPARVPELFCNRGQRPPFARREGNSQPSRLSEQRTINRSAIRSLVGTYRRAALVFPFGLNISL